MLLIFSDKLANLNYPIVDSGFLERLANCYQESDAIFITFPVDEIIKEQSDFVTNFTKDYLDPDTALSSNLDFLASIVGFNDEFWDKGYADSVKRVLIKNAPTIWKDRGKVKGFIDMLAYLDLTAKLTRPGFILAQATNASILPAIIGGSSPFDYVLHIPSTYLDSTPQMQQINNLIKLWIPVYIDLTIIKDL